MSSRRRVDQLREALAGWRPRSSSSRRPTASSATARRPSPGRGPRRPRRPRGSAPAGCGRAPRRRCPRPPRDRRGRSAGCRRSSAANRRASWCTLVTSGQVASIVFRRALGGLGAPAGETPWAENTTVAPSGTSASSSTNTAPRASRSCHDVLVVHDLLADVDGRAVQVERLLDGDHGPVDARAVAARRGQQDGAVRSAGSSGPRGRAASPGPKCSCASS